LCGDHGTCSNHTCTCDTAWWGKFHILRRKLQNAKTKIWQYEIMLLESEIYESLIANKKYLPLFTVIKKAEKTILQFSS
jgi:hypothetical protein